MDVKRPLSVQTVMLRDKSASFSGSQQQQQIASVSLLEATYGCGNLSSVRSLVAPLTHCTHIEREVVSDSLHRVGYWPECLLLLKLLHIAENSMHFRAIPKNLLVLDIGANIGSCTALLGAYRFSAGNRTKLVVALEPSRLNFDVLSQTIRVNGLRQAVHLVSAAAWACDTKIPRNRQAPFDLSADTARGCWALQTRRGEWVPHGPSRRLVVEKGNHGNAALLVDEIVQAAGANEFHSENVALVGVALVLERMYGHDFHIPLVKLDVQGTEFAALLGMFTLLESFRVDVIVLEVEPKLSVAAGYKPGDAVNLLLQCQYHMFFQTFPGESPPSGSLLSPAQNIIYLNPASAASVNFKKLRRWLLVQSVSNPRNVVAVSAKALHRFGSEAVVSALQSNESALLVWIRNSLLWNL